LTLGTNAALEPIEQKDLTNTFFAIRRKAILSKPQSEETPRVAALQHQSPCCEASQSCDELSR
jgi:hypothetical protein